MSSSLNDQCEDKPECILSMTRTCRGGCCSKVWALGSPPRADLAEKCLLLSDFPSLAEGALP